MKNQTANTKIDRAYIRFSPEEEVAINSVMQEFEKIGLRLSPTKAIKWLLDLGIETYQKDGVGFKKVSVR